MTLYEIRRGVVELLNTGRGARKAARLEMLLRQATVHGLDASDHLGWKLAADLWARARAAVPAIVIADADLLITATAIAHDRVLATVDERLGTQLSALKMQAVLHDVPMS